MKSADGSFEDDNFMRQIEFMNAKKIHKKRFEQVLESKIVEIRIKYHYSATLMQNILLQDQ